MFNFSNGFTRCLAVSTLAFGAPSLALGDETRYAKRDPYLTHDTFPLMNRPAVRSEKKRKTVPHLHARKAEKIEVQGRRSEGTAAHYLTTKANLGPLGERDVLDTPYSIMTVPKDVILNQQMRNMNDLAQYIPSVQLEERGDPGTSRPQSRGFEADVVSNSRIDGLNMIITTPYAAEQFDSLQVLNGLDGALYGPQNPAGTFNFTLKRPTDRRTERLSFGVDSIGAPLESFDASGRAGKKKWFGYRIILLNQQGTGYVQNSHLRRNLVAGDFDIRLSSKTTLQIDASQYTYDARGFAGGFAYATGLHLPKAPSLARVGFGQPYAGYNMSTNTFLGKIIHQFNENWSMKLGGLYQDAARQSFSVTNRLLNGEGDYTTSIAASTAAKDFKVGSNLAYLNGQFDTGKLHHAIVLGTNGYVQGNYNPTNGQTFSLGTASLSSPTVLSGQQPYYSGTYKSASVISQSLIAGDTISIGKHWAMMGTLAWSWLHTDSHLKTGAKTSSYTRSGAFTPTASLMYKPAANQMAYFTWGKSLQAGPTAPMTARNANDVLAPLQSEEYELGYKTRIAKKIEVNVALFRMTRAYGFLSPTTLIYGLYGQQRNYGFELQGSGSVTHALSILGGLTWLDARLKGTGTALTSNKKVVGVPALQANLLADYHPDWARGGAATFSIHYMGRRAADVYNASYADAFVIFNIGMRYATRIYRQPLVFRFGVDNLADTRYWASIYPNTVNGGSGNATNFAVAGLPRTYHFTTTIEF